MLLVRSRARVLPEYFSFIGQSEDEKVKWAEEDNYESGANTQKIQTGLSNAAKENSVWLIGGTCPIFAESENKVCNAMFVFDQKGTEELDMTRFICLNTRMELRIMMKVLFAKRGINP